MNISEQYLAARAVMPELSSKLHTEDTVVQSMPDVSPSKWHLAHVTWFFERFILKVFDNSYWSIDDQYDYLFNSYYYTAGQMHSRPKRGLLSRPTLQQIMDYRAHVDAAMMSLIESQGSNPDITARLVLGVNHEQQHQELFLTDIKHVLSCNPLRPAYDPRLPSSPTAAPADHAFIAGASGIQQVGASCNKRRVS
jgi:hypothetical protein